MLVEPERLTGPLLQERAPLSIVALLFRCGPLDQLARPSTRSGHARDTGRALHTGHQGHGLIARVA